MKWGMEGGQSEKYEGIKNIVLTSCSNSKKKFKNPIRNKSHRECEHIVFLK